MRPNQLFITIATLGLMALLLGAFGPAALSQAALVGAVQMVIIF
jgi:hypothetical protein